MLTHAVTFIVCIVSLNAGLLAVAMVVAMNFVRPIPPLLCAAGLAAMAGAVLTSRDPASMYGYLPDAYQMVFAAVLLVGGALLVWLAYARRRDEVPLRAWKLVGVIAVLTLASWLMPIMGRGIDAVGLHQAAREWPSTVAASAGARGRDDVLGDENASRRIGDCRCCKRHRRRDRIAGFSRSVRPRSVPRPRRGPRGADAQQTRERVHRAVQHRRASTFAGRLPIAVVARRSDNRTTIHIGRAGES